MVPERGGGLHTTLTLLAAPKAQTYYPHIGMVKHESGWIIPRQAALGSGYTSSRSVPRSILAAFPG
jgi:hypothetical protein